VTKPILCLDFDGVIHSYTSGWKGADVIPDPPVQGAVGFLLDASDHFRTAIFSARSNQPGGIEAMQMYIFDHLHDALLSGTADRVFNSLEWPAEKPAGCITICNHDIIFVFVSDLARWPSIDSLKSFKPWNKP
jgi:hypothetical protein